MKPVLMILVYLLVVLLPMILSWAMGYPSRPFRHELASGAGMLAFAMILAEFVLSGRFRSVSRGVGLDVTIRFHQLMARTALVLALVHPFLYRNITGPHRPWDVTRQLTITSDFAALATGVAAFVLLPTLVLIAIGRSQLDYKYETWRLMHGLGALLIAGLLLHHAVYAGRYSGDPVMTGLWLAMTGVAVLSLAIVYVFKPLAQLRRPWRVTRVERITPKQWALSIAPDGHDGIAYKAGQFVWLNVGHGSFSLYENPFSLSSAPSDGPNLSFLIKELGDFTGNLGQIAPGARAYIDGPHGTLTVAGRKEPGIALIAGGVGIAPSLGILREMRRSGDTRQAVLVYGNRAEDQIVLRDELEGYARDGIARVVNVLQEPPEGWAEETGVIDAALIGRLFSAEQMQSWLFVLCGPPQMITTVEQALIAGGAPASRILSERFQHD